jgi:hypothetical protein
LCEFNLPYLKLTGILASHEFGDTQINLFFLIAGLMEIGGYALDGRLFESPISSEIIERLTFSIVFA